MRTVYEVRYIDDFYNKHLTFLTSWKDILFLMDRFGKENVSFERTEAFTRVE